MRKKAKLMWGVVGVVLAATLALAGCSDLPYYFQTVSGHLQIMEAAKPIDEWLQEPQTPERLRERLELARRIRTFASQVLHLPDNPSYTRYADLHRRAAVWNVVAAPAYSLDLKTWCFPVTGCVGYRGYYSEARARALAAQLAKEGYETNAYPVTAYSTLGWMNWAGGDPILNTFVGYPDGELARIIFHELAHQTVYAKNDTMFNESFATAVERLGGDLWLKTQASEQARKQYEAYDRRRREFRELSRATRERLQKVYDDPSLSPEAREQAKQKVLAQFHSDYAAMKAKSGDPPAAWRGYDRWVGEANNAFFGAQAAYDELVPGFEALFRKEGGDWQRFYAAVRELANEPKDVRHEKLQALAGAA